MLKLKDVFGVEKPVFGMIHLGPLPGAPRYGGSMEAVLDRARTDAINLKEAGVSALVVENFNDEPFFKDTVAPETVASMAVVSKAVGDLTGLPLGINVLRNSWRAAIGISAAVGAKFVRINILTDALLTDQGVIEGEAAEMIRYRNAIGAKDLLIFADIESKHAIPLVQRPRAVVANDMIERGGADGIIVSGLNSADPPSLEHIKELRAAIEDTPLIIGSGMSIKTVEYLKYVDGTIFGFGAKPNLKAPVDRDMAMAFMDAVRKIREEAAR